MRLCPCFAAFSTRVLALPCLYRSYSGSKGTEFEAKLILFSSYPGPCKKLVGFSFLEDESCVGLGKSDWNMAEGLKLKVHHSKYPQG